MNHVLIGEDGYMWHFFPCSQIETGPPSNVSYNTHTDTYLYIYISIYIYI